MASLNFDAKIFDSLLEPVFVINAKTEVLYCNEAAAVLADVSLRKILRSSLNLNELFTFENPVDCLQDLTGITDHTPYQEVKFTTPSQRSGKVQLTAQKWINTEDQDSWLIYFRDVTLEETLQGKYRAELQQKEDVIEDLRKAQIELEKYSKNLEAMVTERTAQISKLNQTMSALLDSLGQGFFIFNSLGECLEVHSKACLETVEKSPAGKPVWEVLGLQDKAIPGFQRWMKTVFAEMLPFEDLAPLAPQEYQHSQGRTIQLQYYPLRAENKIMEAVVVVATDVTALVEAQKAALIEKNHAEMIIKLVEQKRHVQSFLQETQALFSELDHELNAHQKPDFDSLFRCLHTIKGGAATFSIQKLVKAAHLAESDLMKWKSEPIESNWTALKKDCLQVKSEFNFFIEENISILGSASKNTDRWIEIPSEKLWRFQKNLNAQIKTDFIQEFLMEPLNIHFSQYQGLVQTLAEKEQKEVKNLEISGGEIPVLPEVYSSLFSSFVHAFRNAMDHGIESPEIREQLGKERKGQISCLFELFDLKNQSWLRITIQDDGAGIDPQRIREKLKNKNYDSSHESDEVVIQHVFDSQFSTKSEVSETSGRGVGMDAIQIAAKRLGGNAKVESIMKKGSKLIVEVPYLTELKQLKKVA